MRNIAFVFPGQGAQYPGMGKDFYEGFRTAQKVFECASEVCNMDLKKICFNCDDRINETRFTQIAIFTTSLAILKVVEEMGIAPNVNAGLSLGEYTALASSRVINEEELFGLVKKRGQYMQEAYPSGGTMAAIIGIEIEEAEAICRGINGDIYIANYNCPGQIAITGKKEVLEKSYKLFEEKGAKLIIPLKVSGPFHSPLLFKVCEQLKDALENISINDFIIPYVSNVTAKYINNTNDIKYLLCNQVISSVKWQQSVEEMIRNGVDLFIEIGPGKTLSNMIKKIDSNVDSINIQNVGDLDELKTI